MVNTTTMAAKQGRQIGYQRWVWSTSTSLSPSLRYLGVRLQVRVQGLDLVTKRRLWRRCAWSWIMGSLTVWGDIWSVWGTEYVRSCQTEVCRRSRSRRRWSKRVSPYRYFTKLDVWWGFNNVQIKEGDEWKAAFWTNRGLYEPLVMFFGLTNSPATFQTMMDGIFEDLISEGVVVVYVTFP